MEPVSLDLEYTHVGEHTVLYTCIKGILPKVFRPKHVCAALFHAEELHGGVSEAHC